MEEQKMQTFLQDSLLPAILGLLQVNEHMATQQKEDHAKMHSMTTDTYNRTSDVSQAMETLIEGFHALKEPLVELLTAMNQSNELQAKQNQLMDEMKSAMEQNTARLNILTLSMDATVNDPGVTALYDALKKEGGV